MRNWLSKSMAAVLTGAFLTQVVSAHPGHEATDVAATVSQPFAGPEHFAGFVVLTSVLLVALRAFVKGRRVTVSDQNGNVD